MEFFSTGGEDGIGRALNVGKYERRGQWHLPKNQSPLLFWLAPEAECTFVRGPDTVCTRGPNLTKSGQMSIPNVIQVAVYRPPALVYAAFRHDMTLLQVRLSFDSLRPINPSVSEGEGSED